MPPPKLPAPKLLPKTTPKGAKKATPTKSFSVQPWLGETDGEKIVCYGETGLGKTTLFSMLPDPIFIGVDDGGRRILNPKTGEANRRVEGIETYEDVRAALSQPDLFPKGSSCIIDTFTLFETWAEQHVLDTISLPKSGGKAKNIKHYGWNDGSSHVLDAIRLVLQDLDGLVRQGVNVGLLCQEQALTVANVSGMDYLQACPKLHHDRQYSVMSEVCAWADHVFRLAYLDAEVRADGEKQTGKIIGSDTTRAIYIQGAPYFRAKSRTLGQFKDEDGEPLSVVAFAYPADDAIWQYIFHTGE